MKFDLQNEFLKISNENLSASDIEHMVFEAIESAIGGMLITDLNGTIIYVNKAVLAIFEYPSKEELIGTSVSNLFQSKSIEGIIDITEKVSNGVSEFKVIQKDGVVFYVTLTTSPIYNTKGEHKGQMISLFDITERKTMEIAIRKKDQELELLNVQLQNLAATDPLTGLANRRTYDAHIIGEWRRCMRNKIPLSIMVIDIDYFKKYNDFYGHEEGDKCLIKVAEVIRKAAGANREGDLIARYGGEEFVVILSGADEKAIFEKALSIKKKLQATAIEHKKTIVPQRSTVTLSIGVATENFFETSKPTLFERGDLALYQAKKDGRDTIRQNIVTKV